MELCNIMYKINNVPMFQADPLSSWPASLEELKSSRGSDRFCTKKKWSTKERHLTSTSGLYTHMNTYLHAHVHTCTSPQHVPTYKFNSEHSTHAHLKNMR